MPCVTLPIDPQLGPVIDIGIAAPRSLLAAGAASPTIFWVKAGADSGCSHTSIHTTVASSCGLKAMSKVSSNTAAGPVASNIYLGDLFVKIPLAGSQVFEYRFPDRQFVEIASPLPGFNALLGMDILSRGTFHINGITRNATLCW
jgi:hypothetical protein